MTLFTEAQDVLERLAEMILDRNRKIWYPEAEFLQHEKPIELAYKVAVHIQGHVYFGTKEDSSLYENIGKIETLPAASLFVSFGQMLMIGREEHEKEETKVENRFKIGVQVIGALIENNLVKLARGKFERDQYMLKAVDADFLDRLFYLVNKNPLGIQIHCRPSFKKPEPFEGFYHKIAGKLVRNSNPDIIDEFTPEKMPKVFSGINKQMLTPLRINGEVLHVMKNIQDDPLFTLSNKDVTEEQFEGIRREQEMTLAIADGCGDRKFYQFMFLGNRGRMYSSAVYLSTQGSKLSKSLIQFHRRKKLTEEGWTYLLIHAANSWGFDKALMDDRAKFAEEHLDEWIEWAKNPIDGRTELIDELTGEITEVRPWTLADDPYGFLASILEIKNAMAHKGGPYAYPSGLMVAWDATCSGLQILSSLSKSKKEAELCNLTNSDVRGDYYKAIAEEVWKDCVYTKEEEKDFKKVVKKLKKLNDDVNDASDNKAKRKKALDARKEWTKENSKRIWDASKVFWGREIIAKKKRSIMKRPCMTYMYSCRERTMSKQLLNDWRTDTDFKGINSQFCFWLCVKAVKACETIMPDSTAMMELFIKMGIKDYNKKHEYTYRGEPKSIASIVKALNKDYDGTTYDEKTLRATNKFTAKYFNDYYNEYDDIARNPDYIKNGKDFTLVAPYSGFLMMHYYRKDILKPFTVRFSEPGKDKKTLYQMRICVGKKKEINFDKVKSATSPNVVHMLDAEIVRAALNLCDYDMSIIHDSFSSHACNAGHLYEILREIFLGLFEGEDTLNGLLKQKGMPDYEKFGDLDLKECLDNDYCFS